MTMKPIKLVILFLSIAACAALPAKQETESGTFTIRTSDGKSGTLTIDSFKGRWDADPFVAKLLGADHGHFSCSDYYNGVFLINVDKPGSKVVLARLHDCEWDLLGDGDHGDLDLTPEGEEMTTWNWDKTPTKAKWECSDAVTKEGFDGGPQGPPQSGASIMQVGR
jgi:hypothetical protein